MAKVITFSRTFPTYHFKKGQPTFFVEKFLKSANPNKIQSKLITQDALNIFDSGVYLDCKPKKHTIRAGKRFKAGDFFSPRVWSGKPYNSKQIVLFEDTEIKKVYDFKIDGYIITIGEKGYYNLHNNVFDHKILELAENDGLMLNELFGWFKIPCKFEGQIICWDESVNYDQKP